MESNNHKSRNLEYAQLFCDFIVLLFTWYLPFSKKSLALFYQLTLKFKMSFCFYNQIPICGGSTFIRVVKNLFSNELSFNIADPK